MDNARWKEIIAAAAATAIDEVGTDDPQRLAERAATLGAEWACEACANEDDDGLVQVKRGPAIGEAADSEAP